jgi:tRNA (guanine37-N1)-methyltransferase
MRVDIITPFPDIVEMVFSQSIHRRAREKGLFTLKTWDLRDFTTDKHHTVDDYPYGGGAGMILKPEPFFLAFDRMKEGSGTEAMRVIFPSPQGKMFTQRMAEAYSMEAHLVFLCGHYRGVDQRVIDRLVNDEISVGDYILTGGELAASIIIDAVVRLLPGVLGNFESAESDSISSGLLDYPHYTRPAVFRGMHVPDVLLSGDHARVMEWRERMALEKTRSKRPDLYQIENESNEGID